MLRSTSGAPVLRPAVDGLHHLGKQRRDRVVDELLVRLRLPVWVWVRVRVRTRIGVRFIDGLLEAG